MSATAVQAVGAVNPIDRSAMTQALAPAEHSTATSFSQVLLAGIASVDRNVAVADAEVRAFATGDSIPVHQVTFALEQARLSLELMLQVRTRLVEGFQQIMNMQL